MISSCGLFPPRTVPFTRAGEAPFGGPANQACVACSLKEWVGYARQEELTVQFTWKACWTACQLCRGTYYDTDSHYTNACPYQNDVYFST